MVILGVDPGIAIVGYGVLDYEGNRFRALDFGSILTEAGMPLPQRLKIIYSELRLLIYKYKPQAMAIEELFFNNNAKTAIAVAQGRGVAVLSAANEEVPVYEYTPLQIKVALTGYGRADKKQMQQMTKSILGLSSVPKPDDTADALAVAICHAHSMRWGGLETDAEKHFKIRKGI